MAVVFISPKQRQKMFFIAITAALLLFLIVIFLAVFLAKPKNVNTAVVFNKPKVNVNIKVFDSRQFGELQPFSKMEMQFSYRATTKSGKEQVGFISAENLEKAKGKLEGMDLTVIELKESEVGRDNPFTPYYQVIPSSNKKK